LKHVIDKLDRGWLLLRKWGYQKLYPCSDARRCRVFVAGMQRSGTNMLMDVLEKSLDTDVYHERDPRAFDNYRMRDAGQIQHLVDHSAASSFVIKALCELQDLTWLMEKFEPAKTVWIVRDYNDVVNSMLRSFGNMAKQVHRIVRDPASSGWLGLGMSAETLVVLRGLVSESLDDRTASALQWYFRNILYFEQGLDQDRRVLPVRYEKLVTNPAGEFDRIFGFIGIDFSPRVAAKVSPRSIGKNPPPDIAPPVRDLCDGLLARFHSLTVSAD